MSVAMSLTRLLFVLSIAAVGCAAARRPEEEPELDPSDPDEPIPPSRAKLTTLHFQIDPESELAEDARIAARSWSEATGRTITVSPDGDIPILLVESLSSSCDTAGHPSARGCAHVNPVLTDSWIEVLSSIHPNYRYGTLLHEMGHHLRGTSEHVEGNPDAIMTALRKPQSYLLTPDDVAFVCSGPRFACA
jgi:hypothetical protein